MTSTSAGPPVRVLDLTSPFAAEAYFGGVNAVAVRTAEGAQMKKSLAAYLAENDPQGREPAQELLRTEWRRQEQKVVVAISAEPAGSKGIAPSALHQIAGADLQLNRQLLVSG